MGSTAGRNCWVALVGTGWHCWALLIRALIISALIISADLLCDVISGVQ
ncbi:unnamed protein product [Staurois parvus]|uniref:Uncharacterized protein n=1 Tax=Staurois parvus TaxID=386267 RepID=A0ABN9G5B0_9NEOB|nr:unnamed protein product [Staurois parvus]